MICAAMMLLSLAACEPGEVKRVRALTINNVDVSTVPDGVHKGSFLFGKDMYEVETTVTGHRIVKIDLVRTPGASWPKKAAGVIPRVIERQTPNVDAVSGATATSKAILKAVERSLAQ